MAVAVLVVAAVVVVGVVSFVPSQNLAGKNMSTVIYFVLSVKLSLIS